MPCMAYHSVKYVATRHTSVVLDNIGHWKRYPFLDVMISRGHIQNNHMTGTGCEGVKQICIRSVTIVYAFV